MRNSGLILCLTLTVCLFGPFTVKVIGKERSPKQIGAVPPMVNDLQMIKSSGIIDRCLKVAESYDDYSFDFTMTVFGNEREKIESGTLLFKKPKMIKVEEKNGPHSGAVAVRGENGKIKGHLGGPLKFFVATMSPDNDLLKSINGWPLVDSDYASIWRAMQGYEKEGCQTTIRNSALAAPERSEKVLLLEMTKPTGEMYKRVLLSCDSLLPIEWWDYENGKVFAHSVWSGFKGNQGLSNDVFTMKGER